MWRRERRNGRFSLSDDAPEVCLTVGVLVALYTPVRATEVVEVGRDLGTPCDALVGMSSSDGYHIPAFTVPFPAVIPAFSSSVQLRYASRIQQIGAGEVPASFL